MCPGRRDCDVKERERLRGRRAYVGMRGWPGGGQGREAKSGGRQRRRAKEMAIVRRGGAERG